MSMVEPVERIAVGVMVQRSKGASAWVDYVWRPLSILVGVPDTAPWTKVSDDGEHAAFYAGVAEIELFRSEAAYYRDNLLSGEPKLWVALPPAEGDPAFGAPIVTADPAEGEALAGTDGAIIDSVPMPEPVRDWVEAFVAEHFVDHGFKKRKRDRVDPDQLGKHEPQRVRPAGEPS